MFLHENIELFRDVLAATSEDQSDRDIAIIEKDYYVTMILKLLAADARGVFLRVERHYQSVIRS
jgi:hypothetical protein